MNPKTQSHLIFSFSPRKTKWRERQSGGVRGGLKNDSQPPPNLPQTLGEEFLAKEFGLNLYNRRRQESFSLIEAILAMTILGIAVTGILTTFSSAMLASKISEDYALVANLMGDLRAEVRCNLVNPTDENVGTFPNYPQFTWQITYYYTDIDNLYQVELAIRWMRGNREYQVRQVTYHFYNETTETQPSL